MHDGFTLASIAVNAKTQVVAVGGTIAMTEARMLESHVFAGIRAARTRVVLDLTDAHGRQRRTTTIRRRPHTLTIASAKALELAGSDRRP